MVGIRKTIKIKKNTILDIRKLSTNTYYIKLPSKYKQIIKKIRLVVGILSVIEKVTHSYHKSQLMQYLIFLNKLSAQIL